MRTSDILMIGLLYLRAARIVESVGVNDSAIRARLTLTENIPPPVTLPPITESTLHTLSRSDGTPSGMYCLSH